MSWLPILVKVSYFAAARFSPTGGLDTTFNGNGKVISSVPGLAKSVHWLTSGDVVITSAASGPTNSDFFLTRYTSIGLLEASFGNGLIFTDISGGDYSQKSVRWTDPSCSCTKLVMFGGSDGGGIYGVSFARYVL